MSSAFTTLEQPTKGCRWTSSATSFSAPLRSEASNLFDYGSPTSWGHSSRSPSPQPWRGDFDPPARMFCDITTRDGAPAVADPRNVLKPTLERAAERGFTFY